MPDFLLEIGCEEIPARMINDAEMTLQARVANLFGRAGLWPQDEIDPSKIETLSTPRRLAVIIRDALHAQPDKAEQVMGPPLKVAQKDGQPTAAGEAFSKKVGVPWNQLKIVISAKGEYLAAEITKKGRTALEILAERLPCEIDNIHWPKSMYWRKRGEVFVRPVRWVVAMLDDEVIPVEVFGIKAGNRSRGHRVLADREVAIPRAGTPYVSALHDANVLSRDAREHRIRKALGTYYEKTRRVQRVCSWLAESIRQSGIAIRPGVVHKAACLAKADLTTELVKEFTELQGIVGGLYARVQDLDRDMKEDAQQAIATAIYDHYKPESMEDSVPRTIEGAVLSISDKADSIAGMFSLGLVPSGSKDPFALRRQANGIVKIIAEHKLPLNLSQLFEYAREAYRGSAAEKKFSASLDYADALRSFFRERLEFYLRDVLGFKYDVVNAVLAAGADDVVDALVRAEALTQVRPSEDFESISASFKRIKNILRQASENQKQVAASIDSNLLREPAERELAAAIPQISKKVESLRGERRYQQALLEISRLRPAVDTFFDKVMVMVEDEPLRANRLALLQTLLKEFSTIADFSAIVTEKEKGTAGS